MIEVSRLRMGVDICTETDPKDVLHCFTNEVPRYALEILDENEEWVHYGNVSIEELPNVVENMHHAFEDSIRLVENGYPVFTCWR